MDATTDDVAPRRLESLTGLRAIAAFAVFLFHLGIIWTDPPSWFRPYLALGPAGVSLFFVLSGLVLTWSADAAPSRVVAPRPFWRRRFARIWPAHAAALLLATAYAFAVDAPHRVVTFVSQLALVGPWLFDHTATTGLNGVSWSLACELFFYALFPLLIRRLPRTPKLNRLVIIGCIVAVVVWETAASHVIAPAHVNEFVYTFPIARLPEFVTGMALARLVRLGAVPDIRLAPAAVIWLVAATTIEHAPALTNLAAWTLVPTILVLVAVARADVVGRTTVLSHSLARRGGDASYCFYLVHFTVLGAVWRLLDATRATVPVVASGFAAAAIVAWVLYEAVERPCERLLRGGRDRPRPAMTTSEPLFSPAPTAVA